MLRGSDLASHIFNYIFTLTVSCTGVFRELSAQYCSITVRSVLFSLQTRFFCVEG